jgi:carbonic anhydrase
MTVTEDRLHQAIAEVGGPDTRNLSLLTTPEQDAAIRADVDLLRASDLLGDVEVGGFLYDVDTGVLSQVC